VGSCLEGRYQDLDSLLEQAPQLPALDEVLAGERTPDATATGAASAATTGKGAAAAAARGGARAPRNRGNNEELVREAFCLATPPDNPAPQGEGASTRRLVLRDSQGAQQEQEEEGGAPPQPSAPSTQHSGARSGRPSAPGALQAEEEAAAERLALQEAAACQQRAALAQAVYGHEAVLRASAAVRRRRRRALLRALRRSRAATAGALAAMQDLGSTLSASLSSWDDGGEQDPQA
jgi:hypothetical protein